MRFFIKRVLTMFAAIAVCSNLAGAVGVDSSGGGELLGNATNPWFVENTTEVRYCLDIDANAFQQNRDDLQTLVLRAINFWVKQFELAQHTLSSIKVGTQSFLFQASCTSDTDLRFQFGGLQPAQRRRLKDPQNFVGAAIRTAYDEQALRGRGFIYVSADHGPLRYRGADLMDHMWREQGGLYLYYLLVHELGHVFGVPHMGVEGSIMNASFPEDLVRASSRGWRRRMLENKNQPNAVLAADVTQPHIHCGYRKWEQRIGLDYLDLHEDCLYIKHTDRHNYEVYGGSSSLGPWLMVGRFKRVTQEATEFSFGGFVSLFLTSVNSLVSLPTDTTRRLTLIGVKQQVLSGTYQVIRTGQVKPLSLTFLPNRLQVDGVVGGVMQSLLPAILQEP